MTRAITEEEFVQSPADVLRNVAEQTTLIEKDGKPIAAVVSIEEYESTREARAARLIDAAHAFQRHMASVASPEELADLVADLDRHTA